MPSTSLREKLHGFRLPELASLATVLKTLNVINSKNTNVSGSGYLGRIVACARRTSSKYSGLCISMCSNNVRYSTCAGGWARVAWRRRVCHSPVARALAGVASGVQVNAASRALLPGIPRMPGVLPGPAGDIGEAGAARRDGLVRIVAGRARWSGAAWLLRMRGCAGARRVIGMGGCKRICKRDAAGRAGTGETSRDRRRWPARVGQGQDGPSETVRDAGDEGRMSHNPEVARSNPAPATRKCRSEA